MGQATAKAGHVSFLFALLAANSLPAPAREHYFAREYKRLWHFDAAYVELRIAIEVEGGIWVTGEKQSRHTRGSGYQDDCIKYNAAAIMGWLVIRVTYGMIKDGSAIDFIRAAYLARRAQLERGELPVSCPLPTFLHRAPVARAQAHSPATRRSATARVKPGRATSRRQGVKTTGRAAVAERPAKATPPRPAAHAALPQSSPRSSRSRSGSR